MNTLSIKLPSDLDEEIAKASAQEHISKSTLVRRTLEACLARRKSQTPYASSLDKAGDLVGCFEGGARDLASNPAHMAGFGNT